MGKTYVEILSRIVPPYKNIPNVSTYKIYIKIEKIFRVPFASKKDRQETAKTSRSRSLRWSDGKIETITTLKFIAFFTPKNIK